MSTYLAYNTADVPDSPYADIDPSDTVDLDFGWHRVPNVEQVPPPIDGTSDLHPMDCRCLPCEAERESQAWIDQCEHDTASPENGNPYARRWFCDDCGIEVLSDGPDHDGRQTWSVA